ncbi:M57 family metalloprotease [Chitinophaga nivalis]|uniref:M57 family metalloprotease n=1 Tax=Chitinophaga nivalis TaxID=2991709 RepID=A0ABT3IQU9_9BACT|nr:M57 family metalloprotease [Chitinophaga nivalis]MCW3463961.1 M57 family metalloprotease [Chitinophaga nivalis]MCW3486349.1 M57 family metalloprotease [Chitinophaga nivalis]
MNHLLKMLLCVAVLGNFAVVQSCKKEDKPMPVANTEIDASTLAKIKSQGFSTKDAQKVAGGYVVEGDIFLSEEILNQRIASPVMKVAHAEQYRTANVITGLPRTITISVSGLPQIYSTATDAAIARYNALGLQLSFSRVASGGQVEIRHSSLGAGVLYRSAGFPDSNGNPASPILLNADANALGSNPNHDYLATVIAHEIGHTIGFRHTDYYNISISCGIGGNEGPTTAGVVQIDGSPATAEANSWMLACIGAGVNRTFNGNDASALDYLYGSRVLNPLPDGLYKLVNKNSGKVLDVSGISLDNGAKVWQYGWLNGNNQKWYLTYLGSGYYRVMALHSGKVLDVTSASQEPTALIHQWEWLNGLSQQWRLLRNADGTYALVNRNSGKVVDVSDLSMNDTAPVWQYGWWGGANQRWYIEKL